MDRYNMHTPQPPQRPQQPSQPQRMDGRTRLLIVGGSVAIAAWFAWPYVAGEMGSIGQQIGRMNHSGVEPWDPFGLKPDRGDSNVATPRRPRRMPEGVGAAEADPWDGQEPPARPRRYSDRPDWYGQDRQPRRYRECTGSIWRRDIDCGDWQDGPPPSQRRR
jgi:hypothetical protein